METNVIYQGDCLRVMKDMPKESVNLIYLDPPFFSQKNYDMPFDDKRSVAAFKDSVDAYENMDIDTINKTLNIKLVHSDNDFWKRDKAGLLRYLAYMKERLKECYRVLKQDGSIYLHCDWHASHYLKMIMDEIFGYDNFKNEIVWHYDRWTNASGNFQRMHDIILFYNKDNKNSIFNTQQEPYSEKSKHKARRTSIAKKGKVISQSYTSDESRMKSMSDVWEVSIINSQSKERMGYPTQKPEALLDRIIKASSNENDIVMDCFCGCGTTLSAALKLNRKVIGIDISHVACEVIKERIRKNNNINLPIIITDMILDDAEKLDWFEFQQWSCSKLLAVPGGKGADRGVDGEGEIKEGDKIIPFLIQTKHWKAHVGDDRVRAFKGAMDNKETTYGIIVANKFSEQAITQANDYYKKKQAEIHLITTEDLIEKNFDIKQRTKWNIIKPNYAPWKKKEVEITEWINKK